MVKIDVYKTAENKDTYSFEKHVEYSERLNTRGGDMICLCWSGETFSNIFSNFVNSFDKNNLFKIVFEANGYTKTVLNENFAGFNYRIGEDGEDITESIDFWLK